MKDQEQQVTHSRMQHLALHKALPVRAKYVGDALSFENAESLPSNLHRADAFADRLLEHYMENEKALLQSDLKCFCPAYFDELKKEITRGNTYRTAPPQSLRKRLLKAVENRA